MNPSQIQYREFDHKEAVARLTDVVSAVDSAESTGVQASCLVNVWTLGTYSAKSSPCAPLFLLDPFSEKALVARTTLRIGLGWISMACFVLPWSIAQSGVYLGATGVFGALLLANYTLRLLVSCGHLSAEVRNEFPSYAQIGRRAFGRTGYVIVWAALMCTAVTSCAAYLSFVSQALECLISSHFSATQCLLLVTGALVMVSWMRSVSLLAPSLCLGVATILFGLAVTLAQGKDGHTWTSVKNQEKWAWPGLPLLVANVVFLSFSHTSILSVEQSMLDRANFHRALNFSSVIAFCIYTAFGILACAAYAGEDDMTGNVLEQLSSGNIKQAVWILCAVYLFFTAVLCYLPLWDGLERALVSPAYFGNLCVEALRNLLRAVWIGLAAALAYFLSEFHLLVCLAGILGYSVLGMLLPPLLYLGLQHQRGYFDDESTPPSTPVTPLGPGLPCSRYLEPPHEPRKTFFFAVLQAPLSKQGECLMALFTIALGLVLIGTGMKALLPLLTDALGQRAEPHVCDLSF